MTLEEMMEAIDTFRSWPLEVQQYCIKITGCKTLQSNKVTNKPITKRSCKSKPLKHNALWTENESKQLLADVQLIGSSYMNTFRSLAGKYGRTPKALQDQWHKLKKAEKQQ